MLGAHISSLKSLFGEDQSELRAQENLNMMFQLKDGKVTRTYTSARSGVFARVFSGGVFGSSSSAIYDEAHAKAALERAQRLAKEADARCRLGEAPIPKTECGFIPLDRTLKPMDMQAHADLAYELDRYIVEHCPKITHRGVRVRTQSTEKLLAVTNGYDAHTAIIRAYVDIDLTTDGKDGRPVSLGNYYGKSCYLDEAFSDIDWVKDSIDLLYRQLLDFSIAEYPKAGYHDIILSPDLTGMLAHEAVGHTVEGDGVLGGSIAGLRLGEQVASEIVTLMDYANKMPGGDAHCHMIVDDEGTLCSDVTIIKNGILNELMHSRQTARNLGGVARGNTRASQYYDEPMIRMRNTAIAPGNDTLEDMIASIDDGYYLVGNENGSGALNGEFIVVTSLGYHIKNGRIDYPIKGTTFSGTAFDLLKTVTMVGKEQGWRFGGMCGKKQRIETANGGPAIKCKANMAGK